MLTNKSILITGGTGSFGVAFVQTALTRFPDIKRLVVYSRDELKQYEMSRRLGNINHKGIRYFLGDVRDYERLYQALEDIDIVVHAAALKQVPAAEYNPFEFIKTNVLGTENVVRACLHRNVAKLIALSTDKAAAPINLYGATKLCADKLVIAANNIRGSRNINFSVVRYGNVMGSRGSVIPLFLEQRKAGVLSITDPSMTRFNITLQEGVNTVLWALEASYGGEIFVPKIPSYRITDVAKAIGPACRHEITGIRPGEKIHEEMITTSDSLNTVDLGRCFAILPQALEFARERYIQETKCKLVQQSFAYNSGDNPDFLSIEQIRNLIKEHIDPDFGV